MSLQHWSLCMDKYLQTIVLKGSRLPIHAPRSMLVNELSLHISQFSRKYSQKAAHSSPVKTRSFVDPASDWYSASVPVITYVISYNTGQSSAVITWSNIARYYINNYRNWSRISIRCWIHKRHPIPRPSGPAMGCLLRIFVRKLTAL